MINDKIIIEAHHREAAHQIVDYVLLDIKKRNRNVIAVGGESGSGKSETALAVLHAFSEYGIRSAILGQDDYFYLPPALNDEERRKNQSHLGPLAEVKMDVLNDNIKDYLDGKNSISKPIIDYATNVINTEHVDLTDINVLIVEGTYVSLLRNVEFKVFITRNREDTLEHRKKRNRGNEALDPFIENILKIEHMIIGGHRFLADIIISKDYQVSLNK